MLLHRKPFMTLIALALGAFTLLAACSPAQSNATPTAAPPTPSPVAEGKEVYSAYCAACHGPEAQGTAVAVALPGHSSTIIRRQVRSPMGKMPAFSQSQVSDTQLDSLIAYIESLPASEGHIEPLNMEDAVVMHHWMTIFALKSGDAGDARHHMSHIVTSVTDQEHRHMMEEAMELIDAGKMHDAEHEMEEILAGKAEPDMGMMQLHLRLAFSALSSGEEADAKHHMEHFMAVASGMERIKGGEVAKLMDDGDMHEAGHALEQMMGMTPHGE